LNAAKDSRAIRLTDPSRNPAGVFLLMRQEEVLTEAIVPNGPIAHHLSDLIVSEFEF